MMSKSAFGIAILLIVITQGTSLRVNLTEEAYKYIENLKQKRPNIDSWGLTKDYVYWKLRAPGEYPITGNVESLKCDKNSMRTDRFTVKASKCHRWFLWNITKGMDSPFHLEVNVTVPMIDPTATKSVTLDLNNKTVILIKPRQDISRSGYVRMIIKTCSFSAKTNFNGWFAYHETPRGDQLGYHTVEVGKLQNVEKHLFRGGEHLLNYTITGQYTQITCRLNGKLRPKQ